MVLKSDISNTASLNVLKLLDIKLKFIYIEFNTTFSLLLRMVSLTTKKLFLPSVSVSPLHFSPHFAIQKNTARVPGLPVRQVVVLFRL